MSNIFDEYKEHAEHAINSIIVLFILFIITLISLFHIDEYNNNFIFYLNYIIALSSILALIYHFFKIKNNKAIKPAGIIILVFFYVAVSVISFANLYYICGLVLNDDINKTILHDKTHSIFFSLSNFINKSVNLNCTKEIEFTSAIQTLYGYITLTFLISKIIEVVSEKKKL